MQNIFVISRKFAVDIRAINLNKESTPVTISISDNLDMKQNSDLQVPLNVFKNYTIIIVQIAFNLNL